MARNELTALGVPVHDPDCERTVLGTLLTTRLKGRTICAVREHLTDGSFNDPRHQEVFRAVMAVDSHGEDVNFISVAAALAKAGATAGRTDLFALMEAAQVGDILDYVLRLKELAIRRQMWELGTYLLNAGTTETDDIADVQEEAVARLNGMFASATADVHTLDEANAELHRQMELNRQPEREMLGTPTGFSEMDRRGGLSPTDLVVVAGETSMGKTAFATALAMSAIRAGHPVAFYSMEMSNVQLAARIAAMQSGVNSRAILQERLPDDKLEAVERGMSSLPSHLCYFDDDATGSIDRILASIRTMVLRHGIRGAVVDYLQILNVNMRSTNKEQAMGDVARRLKNLAKELGIWIVALSQLNRSQDRAVPTLDRLRDSGQIGEAADIIALIYRPWARSSALKYPEPFTGIDTCGTAMVDIAKGRNTGIYRFICGFNAETTHFYNIDPLRLPRADRARQADTLDDMPF